MVLRISFLSLL